MSMTESFCAVFFLGDVLDELLDLMGLVSEGFPTYSSKQDKFLYLEQYQHI